MKRIIELLGAFVLMLASTMPISVQAQAAGAKASEAPDVLVRRVTQEVLTILREDPRIKSGDTARAGEVVDQTVRAHFNFRRMTALAVGRDWRQASDAQKDRLADEFRVLLVRTYANAVVAYRDQAIDFRPFRMKEGDTDALVRTLIRQPSGQPIELDYWLSLKDGQWKAYDVVVAGVSLVTNYRDSFGREIRQSGIDGLIASLAAKNKEPVEAAPPVLPKSGKSS